MRNLLLAAAVVLAGCGGGVEPATGFEAGGTAIRVVTQRRGQLVKNYYDGGADPCAPEISECIVFEDGELECMCGPDYPWRLPDGG